MTHRDEYARASRLAADLMFLFGRYRGQRFLGVVDGCGCVEVVFSERTDRGNLCTLRLRDDARLEVQHGYVRDPVAYVAACGVEIEEAA